MRGSPDRVKLARINLNGTFAVISNWQVFWFRPGVCKSGRGSGRGMNIREYAARLLVAYFKLCYMCKNNKSFPSEFTERIPYYPAIHDYTNSIKPKFPGQAMYRQLATSYLFYNIILPSSFCLRSV